jgi:hypothetical protein
MAALQHDMSGIGISFAGRCKRLGEIAMRSPGDPNSQLKILRHGFQREMFFVQICGDWNRFRLLINVLLEPSLFFEFSDEADGLIRRSRSVLRHDIDEGAFDVPRHPFGIAADIDMRAFCEPRP